MYQTSEYLYSEPCQIESCTVNLLPEDWVTVGIAAAKQYDMMRDQEIQIGKECKDLEETCPKFLEDVKIFKMIHREGAKTRSVFMKLLQKEKKEFSTITKSAISVLKTNIQHVRSKLSKTQEYKAFYSTIAKQIRMRNKLMTDWNLDHIEVNNYLWQTHKIKSTWARWRYLPKYVLSKAFQIFIN